MAPDLDPILGELVMDALCAVGLAATPKGCPDVGEQNHVVELSLAWAAIAPSVVTRDADLQQFAQPGYRHRQPGPLRVDEPEPHRLSLAKKASAFFRRSRS